MTKAYVRMVGRMAYLWGWELVNNENRSLSINVTPPRSRCAGPSRPTILASIERVAAALWPPMRQADSDLRIGTLEVQLY